MMKIPIFSDRRFFVGAWFLSFSLRARRCCEPKKSNDQEQRCRQKLIHFRSCRTLAFSCGARSAFNLRGQGYLRNMLSRRQLQGFVMRRASFDNPHLGGRYVVLSTTRHSNRDTTAINFMFTNQKPLRFARLGTGTASSNVFSRAYSD